jgi:hypothetical protein
LDLDPEMIADIVSELGSLEASLVDVAGAYQPLAHAATLLDFWNRAASSRPYAE